VVDVFGFLAVLAFAISFLFYATHTPGHAPWDPTGFMLLGLLFLAAHAAWPWYPGGRRPSV